MNIAVPIYFVLAHFWITGSVAQDPKQSPPSVVQTAVSPKHFQDRDLCREVGALLGEDDKEDSSRFVTEGDKLLVNAYFCLPIFIDKEGKI